MAQPSSRLTIRIPGSGTLSRLATQQGISPQASPSKENVPLGGGDVVRSHHASLAPEKGNLGYPLYYALGLTQFFSVAGRR
jgi:hypothetical protein